MGEVAKILSPSKKVLMPDLDAGCSLEKSCKVGPFKHFISKVDNPFVLTYINSSVEVKAVSDSICTSSSAEKIIRNIPADKTIVFGPDRYLGDYLQKKTGRSMEIWNGTCIVHENFSEKHVISLKMSNPDAKVIAHPECKDTLLNYADFIGSTSQLLSYVKSSGFMEFIILTEPGIIHQMKKVLPGGRFYEVGASGGVCEMCSKCPYMRLNTIEKLYNCLKKEEPYITIDQSIAHAARSSIDKMFSLLGLE